VTRVSPPLTAAPPTAQVPEQPRGARGGRHAGDANISLGDAESSLGDAKSSLGDAKSSLGDAESSLGDAKSSLGDAKSSLGDANVVLISRRTWWAASAWASPCS
jgi:hypothetical protein